MLMIYQFKENEYKNIRLRQAYEYMTMANISMILFYLKSNISKFHIYRDIVIMFNQEELVVHVGHIDLIRMIQILKFMNYYFKI